MLSISFRRLALLVLLSATADCLSTGLSPKPIIIDTDIFSDVDDIGAIAVANTLHNCGIVDLQAVIINTPSEYGALAVSVSTRSDGSRSCNRKSVRRYPNLRVPSSSSCKHKFTPLSILYQPLISLPGHQHPLLQPFNPYRSPPSSHKYNLPRYLALPLRRIRQQSRP